MSKGYVYVVDYGVAVKVGRSTRPQWRVKELPKYEGMASVRVFIGPALEYHEAAEKLMHNALHERRIRGEYFDVPFEEAVRTYNETDFKRLCKRMVRPKKPAEDYSEMLAKVKYIREWRKT